MTQSATLVPPINTQRTMFRGDALSFPVQVLTPAVPSLPNSPLVPANITGWKMWATLKFYLSDPDVRAVSQVTQTGGGIVFVQPLSGIAIVTFPTGATQNFPDGPVDLVYDVRAEDPAGNAKTIDFGTITVWPGSTRSS